MIKPDLRVIKSSDNQRSTIPKLVVEFNQQGGYESEFISCDYVSTSQVLYALECIKNYIMRKDLENHT